MGLDQEQNLRIFDNALWRIVRQGECEYDDVDVKARPCLCNCGYCVAVAALQAAKNWRFHGARWERTQSGQWPRETRMHAAWMKLASCSEESPDRLLTQILREEDLIPSVRDWYVATSVVQWLATNVGMTVLEAAGFSYQQWDQDRVDRQEQAEARMKTAGVSTGMGSGQLQEQLSEAGGLSTDPTTASIEAQNAELLQLRADNLQLKKELEETRAASCNGSPGSGFDVDSWMPSTLDEWNRFSTLLAALSDGMLGALDEWERFAVQLSALRKKPDAVVKAYREGSVSSEVANVLLGWKEFIRLERL